MMADRTRQLLELIDRYKPASMVEVGTDNGVRAGQMIERALGHQDYVTFFGFDLFEDASTERASVDVVRAKLNALADNYPGRLSFALTRGDTSVCLPEMKVDFAFIDGTDFPVDGIRSDYERLRRSSVVVLDGYYSADAQGRCRDTSRFGCNRLVEEFQNGGTKRRVQVLPAARLVRGGGLVQMVLITRG